MTKEQKQFIEMYSFQQKKYSEIETEMGRSRAYIKELRTQVNDLINDIQKIRTKFTKPRKDSFVDNDKTFKDFYDWYITQESKCGYCGITQEDLKIIFVDSEDRILPFLDKNRTYKKAAKRSSGTLEIERRDSAGKYIPENMILACPLCNNAKSNLIDENCWRKLFVPKMQEYYKRLLNGQKCPEKCEHS